ncbi:hypothetical protein CAUPRSCDRAFT_11602 [Caulochytrium protostelioides]|uniref:Uncharacterized protein n=1 Tax=Caulochytrium protostelioides TaxID=1555241 RepID=A0A4P9WWY1_9FUNG|nr:hypothetical protein CAUPRSCDRAFT_11602 [Caulochytrium protostelioides]
MQSKQLLDSLSLLTAIARLAPSVVIVSDAAMSPVDTSRMLIVPTNTLGDANALFINSIGVNYSDNRSTADDALRLDAGVACDDALKDPQKAFGYVVALYLSI